LPTIPAPMMTMLWLAGSCLDSDNVATSW